MGTKYLLLKSNIQLYNCQQLRYNLYIKNVVMKLCRGMLNKTKL